MILENYSLKFTVRNFFCRFKPNCVFVDVSRISISDEKTGIQRVVRALSNNLSKYIPNHFKLEFIRLVCRNEIWQYEYAKEFSLEVFSNKRSEHKGGAVDFKKGDILISPDLFYQVIYAKKQGVYDSLREAEIKIYFLIHDLLPISMPGAFFGGTGDLHKEWFSTILQISDGLICTSKSVADEVFSKAENKKIFIRQDLNIGNFWLGSDIKSLENTNSISDIDKCIIDSPSTYSFLMVGTIEPRKGHWQVFSAFKELWDKGCNVNLIIVGKRDWSGSQDIERYDMPSLMEQFQSSKEFGRHLFVLDQVDDGGLDILYKKATCLIAASEGEGFGLPIVEAAHHRLPVIARDIPVFREVAGSAAYYFENSLDPKVILKAVEDWIRLYDMNEHPKPENIKCISWDRSSQEFVDLIFNEKWLYKIRPDMKLFALKPNTSENHKSVSLLWESGWSHPEENFRWSDGEKAVIKFFIDKETFKHNMSVKIVLNTLEEQRVSIFLNRKKCFDAMISGEKIDVLLKGSSLVVGENRLKFFLPDAKLPGNGDGRKLAVAIREFVLITDD